MVDEEISKIEILRKTTEVVAAYVGNNAISSTDLPALMTSVHAELGRLAEGETKVERPPPAVPIAKSVTRNHIICLEDGKKLKMLKRYLRTRYDLTPEEYRVRWGLPADYPMVAPEYADRRSRFAKEIGLGKKPS